LSHCVTNGGGGGGGGGGVIELSSNDIMARLRGEQAAAEAPRPSSSYGATHHRSTRQALSSAVGGLPVPPSPAPNKPPSSADHSIALHGPSKAQSIPAAAVLARAGPPHLHTNPGVTHLIKKLKTALGARGTKGIVGLSRRLRSMDGNGNGVLCMAEFKRAIKDVMLGITDEDIRLLYMNFDP